MKTMMLALALTTGVLIVGIAQRVVAQGAPDTTNSGHMMSGKMMSGNMMSQMPQMMMGQAETKKLVDQLATSFEAIQAEKDPTALKAKLTAHGELIKQLQAKVQTQSHMMEMMQQQKAGTVDPAR